MPEPAEEAPGSAIGQRTSRSHGGAGRPNAKIWTKKAGLASCLFSSASKLPVLHQCSFKLLVPAANPKVRLGDLPPKTQTAMPLFSGSER